MRSANLVAAAVPIPGEQVLVGVHCEAWVGVAESFGDDLDRYTGGDE